MQLENQNPTETEKLLFQYSGYYLIETNEKVKKYAPVYVERDDTMEFPVIINETTTRIDWDRVVTFDIQSETIQLSSFLDTDEMALFLERMKELNFKMIL